MSDYPQADGMDELTGAFEFTNENTPAVEEDAPPPALSENDEDLLADDADIDTQPKVKQPAVIEITAEKGKRAFNLDPEDKELRRALSFGVAAPRYKKERDEAMAELKRLKAERDAEMPTISPLKQAKQFAEKGYQEQAVRALLGDEGYQQFVKSQIAETIEYENADEATQRAIEKTRVERQKSFEVDQREQRIQELTERLNAQEEAVTREKFMSLGTTYLEQNSFANYVKNEALADKLNQKLWRLAMSDLEEVAEAEGDAAVTPERMKRAFAENARVLRAGMVKAVKERTREVVKTKKEVAKQAAQKIATSRYPDKYESAANNGKWKSAKDLLNIMTRR